MRKSQSIVALLVCLLGVSAQAQTAEQNVVLDISVVEVNAIKSEELDLIGKNKSRLNSLISEGKARPVASVQLRSKSGVDASTRVGQRVPLATGAQAPNASPQIQYENTGLTITTRAQVIAGSEIEVRLSLEMSIVDRSTGNFTPTFIQRNMNDVVRVRPNETVLLLGLMQHDALLPAVTQSGARPADTSRGSFIILMTARLLD
jgi:type II secretory pathway component GspD/PulD (secretin)